MVSEAVLPRRFNLISAAPKQKASATDKWIFLQFAVYRALFRVIVFSGQDQARTLLNNAANRAKFNTSCVTGLPARVKTPIVPSFFCVSQQG